MNLSASAHNTFLVERSLIIGKRLLILAGILMLAVALGFGLLVVTRFLPADIIVDNIARDIAVMQAEGLYPRLAGNAIGNAQDNFTDAVMLSLAMPVSDISAIKQAATSANWEVTGALWEQGNDPIRSLAVRLQRLPTEANSNYATYWQGHVIIVRTLLLLFSYTQIRTVNGMLLLAALIVALAFLWRRLGGWTSFAFLFSIIPLAPLTIFRSMQYVSMFYLAFLGMIVVFYLQEQTELDRWDLELFLILGIATAYFDFLTTPVITWGIPMLMISVLILHDANRSLSHASTREVMFKQLKTIVRTSIAWTAGYVFMWSAKWIVAGHFLGGRIRDRVLGKLMERAGATQTVGDRIRALLSNVAVMIAPTELTGSTWKIAVLIVLVLFAIWFTIWLLTKSGTKRVLLASPLLLIAASPYLWYFVVSNHSMIHAGFTYRAQWVSILGLLLFFVMSIDRRTSIGDSSGPLPDQYENN
ncbi:MAG: hypothetical protein FWE87_04955 [Coriobacteriia bacterium]|nr:hypothetical protein [Coriobacteriia bacterium]